MKTEIIDKKLTGGADPNDFETSLKSYKGKLVTYAKEYGWVLCVGTGTSKGVFPDWNELAKELVKPTSLACCDAQIDAFLRDFGPLALIQAVRNDQNKPPSKKEDLDNWMAGHLSDTMFKRLRSCTPKKEWPIIAKALTLLKPFGLKVKEWSDFKDLICGIGGTSAPAIAEAISKVIGTGKAPKAIISFNAEPLLFALINCYYGLKKQKVLNDNTVQILDMLTHDLIARKPGRIPYYYVHGALKVPGGEKHFNGSVSPGKLVFTENQYLNLANSVYSWQSATFFSQLLHHRFVFVGLSFTDPNLRRWLSWDYESRGNELLQKNQGSTQNRPQHYWLRKRPHKKNPKGLLSREQKLIEQSVAHLGVRIIWLDDWKDIGPTLRKMLT